MSNWSRPGEYFAIPCIISPGTRNPLLRSILLRARFEELQYLLSNLPHESAEILKFHENFTRSSSNFRGAQSQNHKRLRNALFKERL
jgi:predicted component of type VI protein secretion system